MTTVLVVDDEFLIAEIIAFALEDEGYEVVTATDGCRALALIDGPPPLRPDLIVTDFMMPAMNGLELARAVRAKAALAGLPIILMSGAQADIGRRDGSAFSVVFDKPFQVDELVQMVKVLAPPGG
jgi:two-component system, OmpR family, response regulator VicR